MQYTTSYGVHSIVGVFTVHYVAVCVAEGQFRVWTGQRKVTLGLDGAHHGWKKLPKQGLVSDSQK